MKYLFDQVGRYTIVLLFLASLSAGSLAQKAVSGIKESSTQSALAAVVAPVFFQGPGQAGNPSCATLNGLHVNGVGDTRFSHIITNNEIKLDFSNPNGTFTYETGNGVLVIGPESSSQSVTITSDSDEIFSWSSTRQVTAVIMKMGNDAYVYPYKPFRTADANLQPGTAFTPPHDVSGLSHVTFCFGESTGTTAGEASIMGRVMDANGKGVAKAQMVLVNGSTGETKITMTSPFGYFTFNDLDVNELYVLNVSHKRFGFTERQRTVVLLDNATGMDFIADPLQ